MLSISVRFGSGSDAHALLVGQPRTAAQTSTVTGWPDGRHVQRTAGGRHPRTTVEERRWPFITSLDYPIFFILNRYILVTRVW